MKYLAILSVLFLSTCSADHVDEELQEVSYQYQVFLEDECLSGDDTAHAITERVYLSFMNLPPEIPNCEELHTIWDTEGEEHSGYITALKTTDPKYQNLP